jgi:hypothetical protein
MQFVDHEPDNLVVGFSHHANAVSLSQTAKEVFFRPGVFEAGSLDFQDICHISADEPSNLNVQIMTFYRSGIHDGLHACSLPDLAIIEMSK